MLISLVLSWSCLFAAPLDAVLAPVAAFATQGVDCGGWEDCRDRARTAKDAGDFESFHDLAWRAVQKGPRNDVELMTLLARAQSLSGRPGDALVMLQRLAAMGVAVPDAAEGEDFRRVRALAGWADLQARLAEIAAAPQPADTKDAAATAAKPAGTEAKPAPAAPATPKTTPPKTEPAKPEPAKPGTRVSKPAEAASPPDPAPKPSEPEAPAAEVDDAVKFTTIPFEPAGLAYDAVSNRFIIGDRRDRKLNVIGERSQRIATLAGEQTAGFGEVEAIAIDPREGDLWVASTPDGESSPRLHKLQLISGRVLFTAQIAGDPADARFVDIAVNRQGVVFALDSERRRVFALQPDSREVEALQTPELPAAAGIALSPNGAIYLAGPDGLFRLDPDRGSVAPVKAPGEMNLAGFASIRWHDGSLVGIQRSPEGAFRLVRIRLDSAGRRATGSDLLEKDVPIASASSIAVNGDELFYLTRDSGYSATGGMDVTIRRVKLR